MKSGYVLVDLIKFRNEVDGDETASQSLLKKWYDYFKRLYENKKPVLIKVQTSRNTIVELFGYAQYFTNETGTEVYRVDFIIGDGDDPTLWAYGIQKSTQGEYSYFEL